MPKIITGRVITTEGLPLPGIAVTNGRDVVATGGDGRFAVEPHGAFITLTRPTGWHTDQWFERLPAGEAAAGTELVFQLQAVEQPLPYQFMHITDTHIDMAAPDEWAFDKGRLTTPDQLKEFIQDLPQLSPASRSVIVTGDLVDNGTAEEFAGLLDAVAGAPVPVNLVPGNHDHMHAGRSGRISRNNYIVNDGNPALYESLVGPRWFSYNVAGLHVVVMDWHTHELGLDHTVQEEWLRNDLAAAGEDAPYILCMHDQPGHPIMDRLPRKPLATFSGHWHTSRVVDIDGVLHVNSPTPFFAGLDYSPPMFREVTWDGTGLELNSRIMPARYLHNPDHAFDVDKATITGYDAKSGSSLVRWRHQLAGAGHRAGPTLAGDRIYAGSQIEDRPSGTVEALDAVTGELLWSAPTSSAVKTRPVLASGVVVVAEVNGAVTGLDATSGNRLWTTPSTDPYRRFAWQSPVESEGIVVLGDQSDLRALDAATGEVLWRRTDLSPHHNIVTHSSPAIIGDLVMVGFWPTPNSPIAVDLHTGKSIWHLPELQDDPWDTARNLRVTGTAAYDAGQDSFLVPAITSTAKLDRITGAVQWAVQHEGGYSPSTPVITPDGYVVTVTGKGLRMLAKDDGGQLWDVPVDGVAPFPMTAYRMKANPVMAAPSYEESSATLLLPGLDGVIRRFRLDGSQAGTYDVGVPLAAPLVAAGGGSYLTVGVDGGLLSLDLGAES
ncbi:PQQ-binding-like beta-propeller repeat protein [Pseudarthrobacter sp. NPDC058362]|uniref:outer membrane protein assembly factor BamB family protein n=1 Tax=Pseudarthrobacter sp. NPDC058362 TaxID=3346458 RepID=UPI00365AE455